MFLIVATLLARPVVALSTGSSRPGLVTRPAVQMASTASASAGDAAVTSVDVLRVAEAAGRAAAEVVRSRLGSEVITTKASRGDLLTEVDPEVERLIQRMVADAFPSHAFLGEESVPAGAKASVCLHNISAMRLPN